MHARGLKCVPGTLLQIPGCMMLEWLQPPPPNQIDYFTSIPTAWNHVEQTGA